MATHVRIKNLSRRKLRFGIGTGAVNVPAAAPTGTGAIVQIDLDDPTTRRDLYRNLGSYAFVDGTLLAKVPIVGAGVNANGAAFAWANAEAGPIFVTRTILDITTPGLATSTLDIGSTSTALGAADVSNIFAAQASSVNGTFISNNVAKLAGGDFVSGTFKTAAGTGLIGFVYLYYSFVG